MSEYILMAQSVHEKAETMLDYFYNLHDLFCFHVCQIHLL